MTKYFFLVLIIVLFIYITVSISNPISFPDTSGYIELAEIIDTNSYEEYNFARTPGLPFIILLVNYNYSTQIVLQYALTFISILVCA